MAAPDAGPAWCWWRGGPAEATPLLLLSHVLTTSQHEDVVNGRSANSYKFSFECDGPRGQGKLSLQMDTKRKQHDKRMTQQVRFILTPFPLHFHTHNGSQPWLHGALELEKWKKQSSTDSGIKLSELRIVNSPALTLWLQKHAAHSVLETRQPTSTKLRRTLPKEPQQSSRKALCSSPVSAYTHVYNNVSMDEIFLLNPSR